MGYGNMGGMMWGGALWVLLVVLVFGAVAAGVVALVAYALRRPTKGAVPPDRWADAGVDGAADILRRRYAAGEIDEDEFTRRSAFAGRR